MSSSGVVRSPQTPSRSCEALHLAKASLESAIGTGERTVAAQPEAASQVDAGEENVSELGLDPRLPFRVTVRFAQLLDLLVELGEHAFDIRPVEPDRSGPALQLRGFRQWRQRSGKAVESALRRGTFLGLCPLPVRRLPNRRRLEHVRVTPNHLLHD